MIRVALVLGILADLAAQQTTDWRSPEPGIELRWLKAASGIRDGLRRSPDVYLAAVIEVVGEPECSDSKSPATCIEKVKLLDVLARHGTEVAPGDTILFSSSGNVGSRYLAFLVPIKGHPNVYGATSLTLGASDDDRKRFVVELQTAGLKPGG